MYEQLGIPARYRPDGPVLLVLSGPSGVGKDAVLREMRSRGWLLERPRHYVVTATTRPRRPGERDGEDYIFIEHEEFQRLLAEGGFLEYANVYGNWYGVPRDQVVRALERGCDVILKVDVQGAATLRQVVSGAVFVFLAPPSLEELEERLRTRKTEADAQLRVRLETARQEMRALPMFDYLVVNENGRLIQAVQRIEEIIRVEHCRIPQRQLRFRRQPPVPHRLRGR